MARPVTFRVASTGLGPGWSAVVTDASGRPWLTARTRPADPTQTTEVAYASDGARVATIRASLSAPSRTYNVAPVWGLSYDVVWERPRVGIRLVSMTGGWQVSAGPIPTSFVVTDLSSGLEVARIKRPLVSMRRTLEVTVADTVDMADTSRLMGVALAAIVLRLVLMAAD